MLKKSRSGYDHEELYFHELNQNLIRKMRGQGSNVVSLDTARSARQKDNGVKRLHQSSIKKAA